MFTYKDILKFTERKEWDEIISAYEKAEIEFSTASAFFCVSNAYLKTNSFIKAQELLSNGLAISPNNSWARHLKYEVDTQLHGIKTAQDELYGFLLKHGTHETLASTFINTALELDDFSRAKEINERRSVITDQKTNAPFAIALQSFCKADTLECVFESLLKCDGSEKFHLFIIQDTPKKNHAEKYQTGYEKVNELISGYINKLRRKYSLISIISNDKNLGTAPTCRKILDKVCENYEGVLFLEDDCILSKDALELASYMLESEIDIESNYWFGSLESTFYNRAEISQAQINEERERALQENLQQGLYEIDFVPSTCFLTTKEIWDLVKVYRSFPRGPESLTRYVKSIERKTLLPVVPRARDQGMTHELGYSVDKLGKDGVKEHKHHFLDSDDFSVSTKYWKMNIHP